MKINSRLIAASFAAVCAAFASASNLTIGDPAPPITVSKWVQGTPVKAGAGGLRVVEFWATWCGPCKESIPHLSEMSKKYKGKVTFTGVDVFEGSPDDVKTVQAFVKTMGTKMSYNVAVDEKAGTMGKTWMTAAHQDGIPTAFVINKQGTVVWIGHPMFGLDKALDQLIAGTYDVKKAKSDFVAQIAQTAKEAATEKSQQAAQSAIKDTVMKAMDDYKAGKKKDAIAVLDKVATDHPELARPITMMKFKCLETDDKANATVLVDKEATTAGKDSGYAYLQFAQLSVSEKPTKDDYSYALTLVDKGLAIAPKDPIVEFEAAAVYGQSGNKAKAIELNQDALTNVPSADAKIQDRLKAAIQKSLADLQAAKS